MVVSWMKCVGDVWCKLNAVNVDHSHFDGMEGVYMIWHGGSQPSVVYVGRGVVRDRIKSHRTDQRIQRFANLDLYVTLARVDAARQKGVEAYLAGRWPPKVSDVHPNVPPIEANSPW